MQVMMFNKGNRTLVGTRILTTLEEEGVVFYCQDKLKNRYRVPRADVLMQCQLESEHTNTKKGKKRRKVYAN